MRLTFQKPVLKPSSESRVLNLKIASAQVAETSVAHNSPSQDSNHPDDLFQLRYVTLGFKPFPYLLKYLQCVMKSHQLTLNGGVGEGGQDKMFR